MSIYDKYQAVIGLEIHVQLATNSKLFSSESTAFEAEPNSQVGPYSIGHPGTLPRLNEKAVTYAVMMGLALHCNINRYNEFARKNYFYPDLPKGYQISQFTLPICQGGYLDIAMKDGKKRIGITQIHMEEDAGKSLHDQESAQSWIDLNRSGVPLIEIVSEPELESGEEAYQYVSEIRRMVRYLGICDGNMEEGSLRCDANISVMLKGAAEFGQRVEIKNMNSIRNVRRAVEYEIERQIAIVEGGEAIIQQTRSYDADKNLTHPMRSKEMAHDYRYFPEPDIPPVQLTEAKIETIRTHIPLLPEALMVKYVDEYGLSPYDAGVIVEEKSISDFFNQLVELSPNYKAAANWINGPVKSFLNEKGVSIEQTNLKPDQISDLIQLIDGKKINFSIASQQVFPLLVERKDAKAADLVIELNVVQESDVELIQKFVEEAIEKYPEKVEEYRAGRKGILGLFMGEVMKASNGKADPKITNNLLLEILKSD